MSKLDELIKSYCPDGVVFKSLGELGVFYGGLTGKSKKDFDNGNAKYITYMNIYLNMEINVEIDEFVSVGVDERQNQVQYGDILFTGSSESKEECAIASVMTVVTDEPLYLNSFCFGFRLNNPEVLLPEFSKHLFQCDMLRKQLQNTASGVTRFNVSKEKMARVRIPIPPLEVQEEIVRILDEYSEKNAQLIDTLSAELEARKVQYEYYMSSLLSFSDNRDIPVEQIPMGDALILKAGKFIAADEISKIQNEDTSYPCFGGNGVRGYVSKTNRSGTYPIIGRQGALCGNVRLATGDFYATEHAVTVSNGTREFNPTFLFYLLTFMNLNQYKTVGAQPGLSVEKLNKVIIPVPNLKHQNVIAEQLESYTCKNTAFLELVQKEIQLRQIQYEYYRDKLFTFKEVNR